MRHLGIDLAWGQRSRTGLATLSEDGRLVASGSVRTDEEIAAFVTASGVDDEVVVAIDAPLIVPNLHGRRPCEAQVGAEFSAYHAGAYPANRSNRHFDPPRGARLAQRFGWSLDPGLVPGPGRAVAIEVYPHPAMVTLFGLSRVLPYKARRGRDLESLRAAFGLLLAHMERVCGTPLDLAGSARWAEIRQTVAAAGRPAALRAVEDEIDAILCAYLAWLWARRDPRMRVLGDVDGGYIVVPGRPTVPPDRSYSKRLGSPAPTLTTSGAPPE